MSKKKVENSRYTQCAQILKTTPYIRNHFESLFFQLFDQKEAEKSPAFSVPGPWGEEGVQPQKLFTPTREKWQPIRLRVLKRGKAGSIYQTLKCLSSNTFISSHTILKKFSTALHCFTCSYVMMFMVIFSNFFQ